MTKRILLCDDEVHILRAAEFKLTRAGYDVRCAHDGQEGWEAIEQFHPDFVVTDLQMPRLNGFELSRRIRENPATRDLPVLMLTAKGCEVAENEVNDKLGIMAVLAKPFSPRELLSIIERAIGPAEAVEQAATS